MKLTKERLLSIFLTVLVITAMLATTAMAGSPRKSFSFFFNGIGGVGTSNGTKTDSAEATGKVADIYIQSYNASDPTAKTTFVVYYGGSPISNTNSTSTTGHISLSYFLVPVGVDTVTLRVSAGTGVIQVGGYWCP